MSKEEMNEIELIIGKILRIGVFVSVTVMIIGLIMLLITGNSGYPVGQIPNNFHSLWQGVLDLKPYAILMVGILLLILTPVLRVVVSVYAFFKEKDFLYVGITLLVLVILAVAMVSGYLFGH